ncbi:hypothetical protein KI387_021734, partial [Taxus chinensis]
ISYYSYHPTSLYVDESLNEIFTFETFSDSDVDYISNNEHVSDDVTYLKNVECEFSTPLSSTSEVVSNFIHDVSTTPTSSPPIVSYDSTATISINIPCSSPPLSSSSSLDDIHVYSFIPT